MLVNAAMREIRLDRRSRNDVIVDPLIIKLSTEHRIYGILSRTLYRVRRRVVKGYPEGHTRIPEICPEVEKSRRIRFH